MITAKDELKHLAEGVTEKEAETYLAAPLLLEACREMLRLIGPHDTGLREAAEAMRAAVTVAEGRSPDEVG